MRNRRKPKDSLVKTICGAVLTLLAVSAWAYFEPNPRPDPDTLDGLVVAPRPQKPPKKALQTQGEHPRTSSTP